MQWPMFWHGNRLTEGMLYCPDGGRSEIVILLLAKKTIVAVKPKDGPYEITDGGAIRSIWWQRSVAAVAVEQHMRDAVELQ